MIPPVKNESALLYDLIMTSIIGSMHQGQCSPRSPWLWPGDFMVNYRRWMDLQCNYRWKIEHWEIARFSYVLFLVPTDKEASYDNDELQQCRWNMEHWEFAELFYDLFLDHDDRKFPAAMTNYSNGMKHYLEQIVYLCLWWNKGEGRQRQEITCNYYRSYKNVRQNSSTHCHKCWKERCRIIALLNPFSVCDETKNMCILNSSSKEIVFSISNHRT